MREAVARIIAETGSHQLVAAHLRQMLGWGCTQRTASARLSQMLSPSDRHQPPADLVLLVVKLTGRDPFTELLFAAKAEHRAMAKVPAGQGADVGRRTA